MTTALKMRRTARPTTPPRPPLSKFLWKICKVTDGITGWGRANEIAVINLLQRPETHKLKSDTDR